MKIVLIVTLLAVWAALLISGKGFKLYSEQVTYQDGSRHLRCHYLGATSLSFHDISLAGRVGTTCPGRI